MKDDEIFTAITELDCQRQKAMLDGDIDAVEPLLGSTLRYVHASGMDEDRSVYLERLRSGHYQYLDMEPIRRDFRRFGDAVIVNGEMRIHLISNGVEKDFTGRYLQVWVQENGHWMMVAWQTTRLTA